MEHSNRREASLDGVTCLSALCATGIAIWCLVGAVYTYVVGERYVVGEGRDGRIRIIASI